STSSGIHALLQAMNQAVPSFALEIRGLVKNFEHPAVDGLDLRVLTGEFYTLLGPNGAGKTTTLRMVTGLLKPDRGSLTVFGIDGLADPVRVKKAVAWLSDEPMIYDKLTPMEYLHFVAGLWAVESDLEVPSPCPPKWPSDPASACREPTDPRRG